MRKFLYKFLSIWNTLDAAAKGPTPLARNYVRKKAHGSLARSMRKMGL